MSLITSNMGLTISGYVSIGNPLIPSLSSIGNIIALFKAEIGRTLLENWVDLVKLQQDYPTKVAIDSSMVTLQGPVAIIKSFLALRVAIVGAATLVGTYLVYQLSSATLNFLKEKQFRQFANFDEESIMTLSLAIAAISCPILIGSVFLATGLLPFQSGIYFL